MNESFDDLQELAGEYVLGTLSATRRREVEQRAPNEPPLRAAIRDWEARLSPLQTLAPEQPPPNRLWPRIADTLSFGARAISPASGWRIWWNDLRLWRGLSAGGFAVAAILAALMVLRPPTAGPAYMVVLVEPQSKTPGWIVQAGANRDVMLTPLQQDAVPLQKNLQFWTKGDGWTGPVSLGLVQPGKSLKVALDKLPPLAPNQLFEITLEPQGGSPIGKPTGPVLFIGRAVKTT